MEMRNFVTFKSEYFVNGDKEIIDAGLLGGKTLSEYLAAQLRSTGLDVEAPDLDDFAWTFDCKVGKRTFWIHVGEYSDVDNPNVWLVVVNSTLGFIKRAFGQTDEDEMRKMCQEIHQVLMQDERISQVMWHTEEQFNRSDTSRRG